MRSVIGFLILICVLVSACAPRAIPGSNVNGASVVALVHSELGIDADGIEPTPPRYVPFCNAFALIEDGRVKLVTAEHCTEGAERFRYLSPNGVGHGIASVERRDAARDIAWLEPADAGSLAPLVAGPPPPIGAPVVAVSQVFNAALRGTLTARYAGGFYETDQRIQRGWSGSPVFDADGRVWGVVSACPRRQASSFEGDYSCVFGAIVGALEGE